MISPRAIALDGVGFGAHLWARDGLASTIQFFFSNPPAGDGGNELAFNSARKKKRKRREEEALLLGKSYLL